MVLAVALSALPAAGPAAAQDAAKIRVLTTTTDLREIAKEVGGDAVEVNCLTKGPEDPHFLDARPSFVRQAHDADVFVKVGMELEAGYEVPIVRDARNPRIQPGNPGFCNASINVEKLDVPTGEVDRARGDVHPEGNPHYLTDPVRAKVVASTIADSLAGADPSRAKDYRARAEAFGNRVDAAMFGEGLLAEAPARRLERMLSEGKLAAWLKDKGLEGKVGGWARSLLPFSGAKVVGYHSNMEYFADRFHVDVIAHLEPKPGIPPSPQHTRQVVEAMRAAGATVVLYNPFQPKDVPESVAAEVGGRAVLLAHMPGALPGTDDYFSCVGANVKALAEALGAGRPAR
jgi:ABC-type Zn uptake system ZnuABC Zn-binding protein ZnuA